MRDVIVQGSIPLGLEKYPRVFSPDQVEFEEGELCAVLDIELRDKKGKLKQKWAKKSESFTRQFIDLLRIQMGLVAEMGPLPVTDTLNVVRYLASSYLNFGANALVNDATYSIVVGTDSTAPTITDYALGTQIANGSGVGQLQYSLVTFGLPTATATLSYFTITRNFSNASSGAITVNEVGLYVKGDSIGVMIISNTYRTTYYFMTIRDVIAGGITLAIGDTLTLNYRLISNI
jgi:hypothetical protein